MTPVLKLALLLVAALMAARLSWRPRGAGLAVNLVLALGTHFLVLGVLLGPVTGVLSRDVLRALSPFLVLGLGWVGMLMGVQLDRAQLKAFSPRLPLATLAQGTLAFGFAWAAAWLLITLFGVEDPVWSPTGPAVLTLAAVTCLSAPAAVAMVSASFRAHGPVSRLLMYVASLDGVVGLTVVAVVYAVHHQAAPVGFPADRPWIWLVISLLTGVLVGAVFVSLTRTRPSADELVLFLAGTVLFGAGVAYALGLSPLVVGLIAGAVVANLSRFRRRAYATLVHWEKPVYGILLILAGAMLRPPDWWVVPLVATLLVVRLGAKVFGAWAAVRLVHAGTAPRRLGLGLYANGGLALAVIIGYAVNYGSTPGAAVDTVVAGVVLAVALTEFVGPFLLKNVLARAGELAPAARTIS